MLASDGAALRLLREAFPTLPFRELPGYDIRYDRRSMLLNLGLRGPRLLRAVRRENRAVAHLLRDFPAELIISDNRLGCFHPRVKSVFMTHQLHIPFRSSLTARLANGLHRGFMRFFDEIWVPDYEEAPGLAGEMSHVRRAPRPLRYLGPLSRFAPPQEPLPARWRVAAVLSGPEPQRSVWEREVIRRLSAVSGPHVLLRGLPGGGPPLPEPLPAHITVYDHLPDEPLRRILLSSRWVLSRSGYSSLMDYEVLGCRALLVPTPGQPEQEYLARKAQEEGRHRVVFSDH